MSLLTILQTFTKRSGLPVPSAVKGSADAQIQQAQQLLNEVVEDLCNRWDWAALIREAVFVTVAGEDQGALTILAPEAYLRIVQKTFQQRNGAQFVRGPVSPVEWQQYKSRTGSGTFPYYRIRGGRMLMLNVGAGSTFAFEYISANAVVSGDGGSQRKSFEEDSDTSVFPDPVLQAGLRWKWLSTKGLDYAEDFRRYEELANVAFGRETPGRDLRMDGGCPLAGPAIVVPQMNWLVP